MSKQRISGIETIRIKLDDPTRLLERATKQAIDIALDRFGMDDSGYATKVKGWDRSDCSTRVVFDGMAMHGGMTGWRYVVKFTAWCEKGEEKEQTT